ncbi:carboxypeptidase regulatory-like domain-containing protein [Paenibacillus thailandensis]|uniref:Carboxypeptidase regulatory-like domain-containing protein n=1 Tax=Paenibacillus thailandensis TaxID=393250 RepID=A0ABW5R4S6_9BACL
MKIIVTLYKSFLRNILGFMKVPQNAVCNRKQGVWQTVAIEGIPSGESYIVTQTDYSGEDYSSDPANRTYSGTIIENQISEARFVNARYLPGNLTLTADPEVVPGNGTTPSQLTATLIDYEGKPVANQDVVFILPDQSEVTAKTDEQGKAVISYTPPKLETTTPEDHVITAKVDSATQGKLTDTATVTTVPAAITGVLRDNTTGEVIPNATIIVTNETSGEKHTITTDAEGAYFLPVPYGGDYTISFTQTIRINGVDESITFTQKAEVDNNVKGGELVPAEITAVGVVLLKQPEGQASLFNSELTGKMRIYLRDASGQYVKDQNGDPKAFSLQSKGAFSLDGLSAESYKMEVRYEVAPGQELTLIRNAELDVKATGELNISQELVDPYGIVTDETTGEIIEGAEVTLYYANTPRNVAKGIVPGTKVTLPEIPGFEPNDNASPTQYSDANGAYAYMVFPNTDYYLVVTKAGYETHTSPTITVDTDIVRYDVELKPVSSGGNGGGSGSDDDEDDNEDNGSDNGDNGTDDGNNGDGSVDNGTDDGNDGDGSVDNGTGDGNDGVGDVDNGTGNDNNEVGNVDNELDDAPKTGDSSASPIFYMALALMSLTTIAFCLLSGRKKKQIQ